MPLSERRARLLLVGLSLAAGVVLMEAGARIAGVSNPSLLTGCTRFSAACYGGALTERILRL